MSSLVNDNHVASTSSSQNDHSDDFDDDLDHEQLSQTGGDDEELEQIKARVREMEEEAEKLKQMQDDSSQISGGGGGGGGSGGGESGISEQSALSPEEKAEIDSRSIYVGNVDYSATAVDLEKHFHGCGSINRVTILCDKFTGHPKGFAYIEFAERDSVETATALDESLFKGRQIKVNTKRTNKPGLSSTNRPPRGRGLMGRSRGGFNFRGIWLSSRSRGRAYRDRQRTYNYTPY